MLGRSIDLDEAHLPLDELLFRKVRDLDDIDELVELFDDLFEDAFIKQLNKLIDVIKVTDLTEFVEREMCLIKVNAPANTGLRRFG